METRAQLGAVPRTIVVFALLALLTLALATAIAIGASNPPTLPLPFGPAANGLIAYESEGDIFVVQPDGTGLRQITSDPAWEGAPIWSRDGTKLSYWRDAPLAEDASELVVTDLEGADPLVIARADGDTSDVIWSADGTEVMFSAVVSDLVPDDCPRLPGQKCGSRLFVAKTDGSGSTMVGDPDIDAQAPALSPDGTTVAFGGGIAGSEALYLMDWEGSDIRRLDTDIPNGGWAFGHTSWAPDGRRLVTHDGGGSQRIWLIELDDAHAVREVRSLGWGFYPDLAPDGSLVRYWLSFTTMALADPDSDEPPVTISSVDGGYWAPDASGVLGVTDGELQLVDGAGAPLVGIPVVVEGALDWQRVAG